MSNNETGPAPRRYLGHHPTEDSKPHIAYSVGGQIAGWNYVEIVPISHLERLSSGNKIKDEILEKLARLLAIHEETDKGEWGATTEWILRCDMRRLLKSVSDKQRKHND